MPETTVIWLPFCYDVEGVPRGHRQPQVVTLKSKIAVVVPLVSASDLEVALVVNRPGCEEVLHHAHDGRVVMPLEQRRGGALRPVGPADLPALIDDPAVRLQPWWGVDGNREIAGLPEAHERPMREVMSSGEAAARAAKIRAMRGACIVDGCVNLPVEEPFLHVARYRDSFTIDLWHKPDASPAGRFRPDRMADAVAFGRLDAENAWTTSLPTVESTGAVAWRHPDAFAALAESCAWMLQLPPVNGFQHLPDGPIEGWMKLRRIAERLPDPVITGEEELATQADVMAEAMRRIMEGVGDVDPRARLIAGHMRNYAGPSVRRWDELDKPDLLRRGLLPSGDVDDAIALARI